MVLERIFGVWRKKAPNEKVFMEPGELGEPMQEKKLLVLFRENGACSWNGKRTERKGVSVVPDACSTPREGVYTWEKV